MIWLGWLRFADEWPSQIINYVLIEVIQNTSMTLKNEAGTF